MSVAKKQVATRTANKAAKAKANARRKAGKAAKANARRKAGKVEAEKQGYGGRGYSFQCGGKGYKGHRPGSRKERVHKAFDRSGPGAAKQCAKRAGIKPVTLKAWLYAFDKMGEGGGDE